MDLSLVLMSHTPPITNMDYTLGLKKEEHAYATRALAH